MPCYYPLNGYRSRSRNVSGKRSIVFSRNQGFVDQPVQVPCGQCIGCRLERSRQWAVRCMHEASLYPDNCFLTLTYDDKHLPADRSLHVEDFQKFMKKLRFHYGDGIRFFHCGEYGERFKRPHYHACIFNFDFKDRVHFKTVNGVKLYTSEALSKIWTQGFSTVGDVTFESAAYVARYVTKKVTGKNALLHYTEIDFNTGEILNERRPEYVTMSRRPGIGKGWFDKFKSDVFPSDAVVIRGNKTCKPPKYYNAQYEMAYPSDYEKIKAKRMRSAKENSENNTWERLQVREYIQNYKYKLLKRILDDET